MNKKGTNKNTFITYLLITFIIICSIFKFKNIYLDPNNVLEVSITNILYPFTFLLTILIYKNNNFKETHKTIIKTAIIFIIFNLIVSVFNTIPGNYYSKEIDMALKETLTPNFFLMGNKAIYYPDLVNLLSFTLLFYFSHTLLIILYDAMEPYTKKFIAFSLSMFIPFTLETLCYITINNTIKLIDFTKMIRNLTAGFVVVIISTILVTTIFRIITKKDKTK